MLFFSRWPGTATAHTYKFVGVQLKKKIERRRCIPNMRFVREEAYSSAYWLIWRVTKAAISRYASNIVHNLVWDSDLRVRKCQYPLRKNRRHKVRERWICRWQKKSKLVASLPGGKVTVNLNCCLKWGTRVIARTIPNPSQTEQESEIFLLKGRMYQNVSVIGCHPKAP